ncbi:MAG: hypothetical protein HQ507_12835 [Candidatus Marinimicrobia bacterium]|nr:hypothetical protein [Candidatus Neomarinimicrobiota bacterium]
MREVDLYPPLKEYLQNQGYEVKSEVQHCDVIAIRDTSIVVVELKLSLNLTILLQAVDRLTLTNTVYIGVPKGIPALKKHRKRIVKLMRMLGLGLIVIDPAARFGGVDVLCDPSEYKPRQVKKKTQRLLREFSQRDGDPNQGGSTTQQSIMTAYRQKSIAIATYLRVSGESKAAFIAKALTEAKTRIILYDNVYGWFERHGKGRYSLSSKGLSELDEWISRNQQ